MAVTPRILIAPRTGTNSGLETQFIYRGHSDAVHAAGGYSFSPHLPQPEFDKRGYGHFLREMYDIASGVVLVGGTDCDPARYGEQQRKETDTPVRERDVTDFTLIEWAIEDGKPILAVCAGSQRFNVHYGGTLYQDVDTDLPGASGHNDKEHRTSAVHDVRVVSDHDLVQRIYEGRTEFGVNSTHHQAIRDVGQGLEVMLRSPTDGIVEGTFDPNSPFAVAVQYHPEAMWEDSEQGFHLNVYRALVENAREFMGNLHP
tara:strand:- start:7911 stop:8684 length:774 start_codon:yes stop_codon:yes gene_type:complete